jgi:hypothetical protein
MREATRLPPDGVLDRAAVSIVSVLNTFPDLQQAAADRGYERRFDDGHVSLFRRSTLPRFFFSSDYQIVTRASALEAIANAPPRQLILEDSPGVSASPNGSSDRDVTVVADRRNSTVLVVDADRPGLLYAAESFFEGWTATVNGVPARILPANYAFRAVTVPAGSSVVEFHYRPPGLTVGLQLSGVSGLVVMLLLLRGARGSSAASAVS